MPPPLRVRYSKIREKVDSLLERHGVNGPPVPVEKIARLEKMLVKKRPLGDEIDGFLLRSENLLIIGVNQSQSIYRQRFTIAHELGHALLHDGEELHVDRGFQINFRDAVSSLATNVEERESNTFAAWLLMPYKFLIPQIRAEHLDIEDSEHVDRLAKRYLVSSQAMTYRLANMAIHGL